MEQTNLLTEFEVNLVQVTSGKRFANYIIDLIIFYLFMIALGIVLAFISPALLDFVSSDTPGAEIIDRLISLILYGFFMGFYEYFTKGRTIGKIITGTKAVQTDGSNLSFDKAMLRGLCRAIPFEPFSAFGYPSYPWHDKWTNTFVVNVRRSTLPEQTN